MDYSRLAFKPIHKLDEEEHLVFGWFSIVEENGVSVVDKHGDIISESTLEKAAYDFVLKARMAGDNHTRMNVGQLVESIVFTKEKQESLGIDLGFVGWYGGFRITDEDVWKKIKMGEYPSFSIGGTARRVAYEETR